MRGWLGKVPSMRRAYQTDLSDAEWSYIEPHLPTPKAPGRPRVHPLREILDAIFYILRSGCAWRLLPHDFPPWKTIHHYFRTWRIDGTWERVHAALRKRLRVRMDRDPEPSAGVVDSQGRSRAPAWEEKSAAIEKAARRSKALKATPVGRHAGPATQSPAVHSAKVMDFERGSRRS